MHGYIIHFAKVFVFGLIILLKSCVCNKYDSFQFRKGKDGHFTNLWAVHINGTEEFAQAVAKRNGFIYKGKVIY